ncbi:Lsr2 family DNA-binding protein, partial [Rhodococcus opacus]
KKTVAKKTVATKAAAEKTVVKKRVAPKAPVTRTAVNKAPAKKSSREIREWAIGAGHEVSSRGRIPAELEQAFHDAQAKKV